MFLMQLREGELLGWLWQLLRRPPTTHGLPRIHRTSCPKVAFLAARVSSGFFPEFYAFSTCLRITFSVRSYTDLSRQSQTTGCSAACDRRVISSRSSDVWTPHAPISLSAASPDDKADCGALLLVGGLTTRSVRPLSVERCTLGSVCKFEPAFRVTTIIAPLPWQRILPTVA